MFGDCVVKSQFLLAEKSQRIELWKFEVLNLEDLSAGWMTNKLLLLAKKVSDKKNFTLKQFL